MLFDIGNNEFSKKRGAALGRVSSEAMDRVDDAQEAAANTHQRPLTPVCVSRDFAVFIVDSMVC